MSPDFKRRCITTSLSVLVLGFSLAFAHWAWVSLLIVLTGAALVAVASWEYAQLSRRKGIDCLPWISVAGGALHTFAFFLALILDQPLLPVVSGFFILLCISTLHFREPAGAVASVACEFFPIVYVATPVGLMIWLLYHGGYPATELGICWLVYLLAVTKSSDVAAYCSGKLFGRKRLAPQLSPKKTIEGAVGGWIAAILVSVVLSWVGSIWSQGAFFLSFWEAVLLGAALGALSQFGDLAESVFKRDAGVKDSNQLPGLGGVLDVLDSLLFAAPFVYLYLVLSRG